jgi:hypothetical protein
MDRCRGNYFSNSSQSHSTLRKTFEKQLGTNDQQQVWLVFNGVPFLSHFWILSHLKSKYLECTYFGTGNIMDVALSPPGTYLPFTDQDSQKKNPGINCFSCFHF